ncbi:unnamed protein product [Protopolystoma xenopodis]|uniref:Uncharacterized protein n=1 Tax=Protopolystoma xenopodis TaxID=117903 RepID=A0A448X8C6_9PLAT|nr:unnamed protein product [Protopolystoma xenopodis]
MVNASSRIVECHSAKLEMLVVAAEETSVVGRRGSSTGEETSGLGFRESRGKVTGEVTGVLEKAGATLGYSILKERKAGNKEI